jgi:predicted ATP-dependent protease
VDVQRAIDESIYRSNLYEEHIQELIGEDMVLISTGGTAVGQINALSVISLGDYAFGHPTRLTASAYPGQGGIIDIERQSNLGGALHTKGMLILSGFVGDRYARNSPLSLTASLTFEQSYDGVEGDSASVAEVLALLSAISQVPLRQDRAITGSVNQHGQIQAVGGINEKIEGFFAVCQPRGLTGEQGVVIPKANVRNLMLREDVMRAVAEGKFHVWPVDTIDEALRLFTDLEPGELKADGSFPSGTFNEAVQSQLERFAKLVKPQTPVL